MIDTYAQSPHLYCCCVPEKPPRFSCAVPMTSVMAGSAQLAPELRQRYLEEGFAMDDEGDNISSLNAYFGDLTTLYWAWKNTSDEYVGVCQYRRPWNDEDIAASEANVLYTPGHAVFGSVEQQYMDCHSVFPAPALTRDLARRKAIPLSHEMIDHAWRQNKFYGCNMARGSRSLFDKYCELVFATVMPLWEENKDLCLSLTGYQSRSIAFAAERLITAIILNADYFFGSNKVKEARIGFTG